MTCSPIDSGCLGVSLAGVGIFCYDPPSLSLLITGIAIAILGAEDGEHHFHVIKNMGVGLIVSSGLALVLARTFEIPFMGAALITSLAALIFAAPLPRDVR